jgi:asparagine synthase (glutamine-hydrolysing)
MDMLRQLRRRVRRFRADRRVPPIVRKVRAAALTYLDETALTELFESVRALERRRDDGILIEAGCALGGSAIVIATGKSIERPLFVFDAFGMIPPPSEKDDADVHERYHIIKSGQATGIRANKYYGYEDNLFDKVVANFQAYDVPIERHNVRLIKGLFQATLHVDQPVALAHLDGDWYESVMTCLQRIEPHLIERGVLVIDDYDAWSGCRKAVDEYFQDKRGAYEFVQKARLHIVRTAPRAS